MKFLDIKIPRNSATHLRDAVIVRTRHAKRDAMTRRQNFFDKYAFVIIKSTWARTI